MSLLGWPPCDDYSGYDDYTDLLVLDQLETMNRTLRDIESHMREALHQEAWDRMLGRYRWQAARRAPANNRCTRWGPG